MACTKGKPEEVKNICIVVERRHKCYENEYNTDHNDDCYVEEKYL